MGEVITILDNEKIYIYDVTSTYIGIYKDPSIGITYG